MMRPENFVRYIKDLPMAATVKAWSVQHEAVLEALRSGEYIAPISQVNKTRTKATRWMSSQMSLRGLQLADGTAPIWIFLGDNPLPRRDAGWGEKGLAVESRLVRLLVRKADILISWHYPYTTITLPDLDAPWNDNPDISAPHVREFAHEYNQPIPFGEARQQTLSRIFDLSLINDDHFTRWRCNEAESEHTIPGSQRLRLQATATRLRSEHIQSIHNDW